MNPVFNAFRDLIHKEDPIAAVRDFVQNGEEFLHNKKLDHKHGDITIRDYANLYDEVNITLCFKKTRNGEKLLSAQAWNFLDGNKACLGASDHGPQLSVGPAGTMHEFDVPMPDLHTDHISNARERYIATRKSFQLPGKPQTKRKTPFQQKSPA